MEVHQESDDSQVEKDVLSEMRANVMVRIEVEISEENKVAKVTP
jgi:hypothetical protein